MTVAEIAGASPAGLSMRRLGAASVTFAAGKSAVFLAPLALAVALEPDAYGAFELAVAWATPAALAIGIGIPGGTPYFLLERREPEFARTIGLYGVLLGLAAVLAAGVAWLGAGSVLVGFAILATAAMALQGMRSAHLKVLERPGRASLVESGFYIAILATVAAALATGSTPTLPWLTIFVAVYVLALIASHMRSCRFPIDWDRHSARFRQVVSFGMPLIAAAVLMALLTSSGRLIAGNLLSLEDVAAYGFFFRLSAIVILLHQLANTLLFRRIYTSRSRALDRYFTGVLATILIAAGLACAIGETVLDGNLRRFAEFSARHPHVYWLLSLQMFFWSALALAEFILYREKCARHLGALLSVGVAVFAGVCWMLHDRGSLTLSRLCMTQACTMALVFFAQTWLLRSAGVRLIRAPLLAGGVFVVAAAAAAWLEITS